MNGTGGELEDDRDSCTIYRFTRADIDAVNCFSWYDKFKEISPKTKFLMIPPEVLKYLKSDGMVMPQNTHTTAHLNLMKSKQGGRSTDGRDNAEEDEDDNGSWASISDNEEVPSIPSEFLQKISREQRGQGEVVGDEEWERQSSDDSGDDEDAQRRKLVAVEKFHEFDSLLDVSIKELGGAVVPKVNRKSPRDATWIGFNRSLKCYNPGDIYLLLKTSDVVSHLLEDPYKDCCNEPNEGGAAAALSHSTMNTSPYTLVLKEWNDSWGPEMEFRCFICANQLIAICQRDLDTCYSSIVRRKDKLLLNIQNFFLRNIYERFSVDFYIMDIVCHPNGEIYVVDFDVFGLCTDPLLFTYRELESMYQETFNPTSIVNNDDNRLRESPNRRNPDPGPGQPCLRFLTESRNFRARKSPGHTALANDVMTYIRESVSRK